MKTYITVKYYIDNEDYENEFKGIDKVQLLQLAMDCGYAYLSHKIEIKEVRYGD